ncbi:hypothetical protein [Chengkuizengella axinellae]|uniref:Extracellular protein n=1 Tax=Chengkuizengella axinellae TaxID=3064388 RepID=A0ABT9J189_9BACL|nr:hypothetical protein [Chengkuizengella sp. 2205SS18-9]MDP5275343.1 hypothetical protein [Chengkuizengella sp. 2205SS18-9]
MKQAILIIVIFFVLLGSYQQVSHAYTYGDPNEELIAEVYKAMDAQLNVDPPNFTEAETIYLTVKEDIELHMGIEPSQAVMDALEAEDSEAVMTALENILVLNIARRLEYIEQGFDDYATTKLLLAKGLATYDALSPIIIENDKQLDDQMRQEFNLALDALGNPGLFGVGEKESDIDAFVNSKEKILNILSEQFQLENVEVGHFVPEEGQVSQAPKFVDLNNIKNWIPIIIIFIVIILIVVYALKKRNRGSSV